MARSSVSDFLLLKLRAVSADKKADAKKEDEKPKTPEKKKTPVETRDAGGGLKVRTTWDASGDTQNTSM